MNINDGPPQEPAHGLLNSDSPEAASPSAPVVVAPAAPLTIGQRLRHAREAANLSLQDVATKTRVNRRMLDAIERDAFAELPIGPYAASFARSFATAVGLDGNEIGEQMRAAAHERTAGHVATITQFEPADASRTPSRGLAFGAAAIAGLILAAYLIWQAMALRPATQAPAPAAATTAAAPTATPTTAAPPETAAPPIAADAPILISATSEVWFSLEDANGRSQFDLTLGAGEYYTVKANQRGLFLRTGAPQNVRLMVDGQPLPPLGEPNQAVRGVALDTMSLARRRAGLATTAAPFTQQPAAITPGAAPLAPPSR